MTESPARRATLTDAMILVAATALGLALSHSYRDWLDVPWQLYRPSPSGTMYSLWVFVLSTWATVLTPCLLAWTFVLPVLRRRRPGRGRAGRRTEAGVAATTGLILVVVALPAWLAELNHSSWRSHTFLDNYSFHALQQFGEVNGLAIGAVWLSSILGRGRRRRPDWIEGMARLIGVAWIGLSAFSWWLGPLARMLG